MKKRALITGITGQDGSYLAELLLAKGYEVHGIVRRSSARSTPSASTTSTRTRTSRDYRLRLHLRRSQRRLARSTASCARCSPTRSTTSARRATCASRFDVPEYTGEVTGPGHGAPARGDPRDRASSRRFYQASSSRDVRQRRRRRRPRRRRSTRAAPTPCAKVYAYWITRELPRGLRHVRRATASSSTTRSPRRGETFVTRKITRAAARIKLGLQEKLFLGNLDAKRDWGFAGDYVEAMWLMLQQDKPDDYVIATGESALGARVPRRGVRPRSASTGRSYVEIDPRYFRPAEVDDLRGDVTKARRLLGWEPKVKFDELVAMMVDADLKDIREHGDRRGDGERHSA